jgi:hypothetical protein
VDAFKGEGTANFAVQTVAAPTGSVNTLYPVIGDAVGNLMLISFVGLIAGLWWVRKRGAARAEVESVAASS